MGSVLPPVSPHFHQGVESATQSMRRESFTRSRLVSVPQNTHVPDSENQAPSVGPHVVADQGADGNHLELKGSQRT